MALMLNPSYNLYEKKEIAFCSSLQIANEFNKEHYNVLRDIENLDCSANFSALNFEGANYKDEQNKKRPMYLLTKDVFMFLVMGYRGKKAAFIKEAYIKRFNDMENFIKSQKPAKEEFLPFTQAIMNAHEEPKSYHFSNECNMINGIVLGMNAKKFKEIHGLNNVSSIRPFLSDFQVKAIRILQTEDIPLLYKGIDFQKRKIILTNIHHSKFLA